MSDGTDSEDRKNTQKTVEAEIVEAEVVSEDAAPMDPPAMKTIAAPSPRKSGIVGWITAGILAAFLGGVYASPYFEAGLVSLGLRDAPLPTAPAEDAVDLAPLKADIASLNASLARHQEILAQQQEAAAENARNQDQLKQDVALLAGSQNPVGAITGGADIAALKAEVARLTDDLARLLLLNAEADPAVSQLSGTLALARAESAQLKERLKGIEDRLQAVAAGALEASPRGRLVLALSRMKDRALSGLPFAADVAGLRADISQLSALDQQLMGAEIAILDKAGAGITPYASLVRDFDPSVAAALRAGDKEAGSFLSTLFTSRRTDAGATGADAVFVKAERLLLARDIAGAVEALSALDGAVSEAVVPWRKAAEAHVAVGRAFDRLIKAVAHAGPATAKAGSGLGGMQ